MMNQQFERKMFGDLDVEQKSFELLSKLDSYGQIHFDKLVDEFVACFEGYCEKIASMQEAGKKGAIAFINFSVLRTNILARNHELRIDAYDENWYLDRGECSGVYDVSQLYRWLDVFADNLEATRKKYMGKLKYSKKQKLIFEESDKYLIFVAELMRVAIKKAVQTEAYHKTTRHEVFVICIGGYQDRVDILYKEDSSAKDAKVVRRYLEKEKTRDEPLVYEICEGLDLSKGDFTGLNLMFSSFAGCDFSDGSFKDSTLLMNDFTKATLCNTNLENSQIFDTDFSGSTLENVSFKGGKLKHVSFKDATLVNVDFEGVLLAEELNFENVTLKGTEIPVERDVS